MSKPLDMNPEIRTRWVAALRSGKYRQGTGNLKNDGGYCCLGVLCELAVEDGVIPPAEKKDDVWWYYEDNFVNYPSSKVCKWAGLASNDPHVKDPEAGVHTLSKFNDGNEEHTDTDEVQISPHSFDQIANLIETGG